MRILGSILIVPAVLFLATAASGGTGQRLDRLILQAKGEAQFYDGAGSDLGWFASLTTRNFAERARIDAVRLLAREGANAAAAVDPLIELLANGPNDYDTGDGIIPFRSEVALALGRIGDAKAVDALVARIRLPPEPATLTAGASVAPAGRTPTLRPHIACAESLALFGARAGRAIPALQDAERSIPEESAKRAVRAAVEAIRSDMSKSRNP